MLWAYVANKPGKWKQYLLMLGFAYNSCKNEVIGYSPSMLMCGFQPLCPNWCNCKYSSYWGG